MFVLVSSSRVRLPSINVPLLVVGWINNDGLLITVRKPFPKAGNCVVTPALFKPLYVNVSSENFKLALL
ncbi:hypothetical protein D3C72_1994880 [compost metagenome]